MENKGAPRAKYRAGGFFIPQFTPKCGIFLNGVKSGN